MLSYANIYKNVRNYSTKIRNFKEVKIPVPWGHISGKWWEPYNSRPILTLHGWQDNCGSFDRLIPLLKTNVGFLAIDLPGHGYSSRFPPGMHYFNMIYPILIQNIANYFNWTKTTLMAHSFGAFSCLTYTTLFPNSVDFLISLDGVKPFPIKETAARTAECTNELLKYDSIIRSNKSPPSYSLNELKERVSSMNNNSIAYEYVETMLKRNIAEAIDNPGKFYITRDPRLKSRWILSWDCHDLFTYTKRITCPVFAIKAPKYAHSAEKQNFDDVINDLKEVNTNLELHHVEGTHHFHFNNPSLFSDLLNDFIEKCVIDDRRVGGITQEIIVN